MKLVNLKGRLRRRFSLLKIQKEKNKKKNNSSSFRPSVLVGLVWPSLACHDKIPCPSTERVFYICILLLRRVVVEVLYWNCLPYDTSARLMAVINSEHPLVLL